MISKKVFFEIFAFQVWRLSLIILHLLFYNIPCSLDISSDLTNYHSRLFDLIFSRPEYRNLTMQDFWIYLEVLQINLCRFVRLLPAFLEIGSFSFSWFLAQRCKIVMPKMWRSPIFGKKINSGNMPEKPVFGFSRDFIISFFSDFFHKDAH